MRSRWQCVKGAHKYIIISGRILESKTEEKKGYLLFYGCPYPSNILAKAGNPNLMTAQVQIALSEHAAGNYQLLMNMANELLLLAASREIPQIDEKLFFEAFDMQADAKTVKKRKS